MCSLDRSKSSTSRCPKGSDDVTGTAPPATDAPSDLHGAVRDADDPVLSEPSRGNHFRAS